MRVNEELPERSRFPDVIEVLRNVASVAFPAYEPP
jgi:hypothetical protein